VPRVYPSRYQTFIGHLSDISDTLKAEDVRYLALRELSGSSRIETPQNPRSLAVLKLRSYRNVATRKRFAFSRTPPAFAPTVLTLRTSVRRALAGHASFTSPPPAHSPPAPSSHNTLAPNGAHAPVLRTFGAHAPALRPVALRTVAPHTPSPAPPATDTPPSSPRRHRTGRSPPSPAQTSGDRGPPAGATPSPAALPS
jgi:hypothetical protein